MINKQSISKNFFFQYVYQLLVLVIPLVLAPYLSRTLRETALGIFSYANSIAAYFVTLSMLGIARHGQRIISENANNNIKLRKAFWSLFVVHIIVSVISIILYSLFVAFFIKSDRVVFRMEILYVASALFDITWLFYGLENFKSVVIKNALIKIFECVLVFIFVKSPNDLGIYTFINASAILIGQAIMLPQAIKAVRPIRFNKDDAKEHIKPLLVFSISVIASFMYTVFDKTLLGIMSTKESVAFYEYSNRIVSVPKTIIGVTGTVMFPRACRLAAEGNIIGQRKYIKYSYFITSFLGMAALFGLMGISDVFSVLYYGDSFRICGKIIVYMAPLIYIVGAGDIIRTQYMIPNHMDKQFNICIIFNAIINLILSASLIPLIGVFGAVVGSVSAEIFGLIVQIVLCRKFVKIKEILSELIPFILIGGVMLLCIRYVDNISSISLFGLILKLLVGSFVYCALTAIYILRFRTDIKIAIINKINYKNRRSI
ncbi:oligosaccharide flippase family protein [Lachnoanaerobaculum gingivalis]|nr:oligosaccharide flippase family protein [Lachnoanaerobaculum gingivalis]